MTSYQSSPRPCGRPVLLVLLLLFGSQIQPVLADDGCSAVSRSILEGLEGINHDYKTFSSLPLSHRRVLYQSLTPAGKRALWIEHVSRYAMDDAELTAEQLEFLESIVASLEKGLVLNDDKEITRDTGLDLLDGFRGSAERLWAPEDLLTIFAVLGPIPNDPKGTFNSRGFLCECSVQSDFCLIQGSDCQYTPACTYHPIGCGFLWDYPCDGLCFT